MAGGLGRGLREGQDQSGVHPCVVLCSRSRRSIIATPEQVRPFGKEEQCSDSRGCSTRCCRDCQWSNSSLVKVSDNCDWDTRPLNCHCDSSDSWVRDFWMQVFSCQLVAAG